MTVHALRTEQPRYHCENCGHLWGPYEDYCHCAFGVCNNPDGEKR